MLALQNVCDAFTYTGIHWWWLPCYAQFFFRKSHVHCSSFHSFRSWTSTSMRKKCSTHVCVSFFRESFPLISSCHRSNIMCLDITDQSRQCKTHQVKSISAPEDLRLAVYYFIIIFRKRLGYFTWNGALWQSLKLETFLKVPVKEGFVIGRTRWVTYYHFR